MKTAEALAWFKRSFGPRIAAGVEGTPFSVDLVAAIAQQETGYIWGPLVRKGMAEPDLLRLCVGDTLDADRGRSCFPRTKTELLAAPQGREMFAIARAALLEMAEHSRGYRDAAANPNKFCHGFGIFQYDLQFYRHSPAYFLEKRWCSFEAALAQFIHELKQAQVRQRWGRKTALSHDEQVFVAIAYNKGSADTSAGFAQGHKCEGRCYGENVHEFIRLAQSISVAEPAAVPAPSTLNGAAEPIVFSRIRPAFEVTEEAMPLRSEPGLAEGDADGNVIVFLPKGHLVQRASGRKYGDFLEVETTHEGDPVRGFAPLASLLRIERAQRIRRDQEAGKSPAAHNLPDTAAAEPRQQGDENKRSASSAAPAGDLVMTMDVEQMIRAVQKALGIEVDGRAGPETWKAIFTRVTGKAPPAAPTGGTPAPASGSGAVDPRSEKTIATLQPEVRSYARALVKKAASIGINIKVISGLRTYAEQNELYAKGRTKPGPKVTNAPGGYSNHNFGIAFDVGVFDGSKYIPESSRYKAVGALGVELGLEWGGNWKTIQDEPHFQLRPRWAVNQPEKEMLAELRSRSANGRPFFP